MDRCTQCWWINYIIPLSRLLFSYFSVISLRLDFGRDFLLCIYRLKIQSRKHPWKSTLNEIMSESLCLSCHGQMYTMLMKNYIIPLSRLLFSYFSVISLRLDFGRDFLLCIYRLKIQSRKFLRKSNLNEINFFVNEQKV
jgi:hypothetical protein